MVIKYKELNVKPKEITIGVCKGRPFCENVAFLRQKGLKVIHDLDLECDKFKTRNLHIKDEMYDDILVKYVIISSRDFADYLKNNIVDMAVGYDDSLYHIHKKDYNLKPIEEKEESSSKICLLGNKGADINNEKNKIYTEYINSKYYTSIFKNLNVKGTFVKCEGSSESFVLNDKDNFCITIVETGKTLEENNLKLYQTLRYIKIGIWCNVSNFKGYFFYNKWNSNIRHLFVDGVDGSGKDTLLDLLSEDDDYKHYVLVNRSKLTDLTMLHFDYFPSELKDNKEDLYIVLGASVDELDERITKRNTPRDMYETEGALSYYDFKYQELCFRYGLYYIDTSSLTPNKVKSLIYDIIFKLDTAYMYPQVDGKSFDFYSYPIITRGESKEIRSLNDKFDVIQLIPSIYSHKKKRAGIIEGTDLLRMKLSRNIRYLLAKHHILHTWKYIGDSYIVVEKLKEEPPPIEVVIKSRYEGTDKYRYVGLDKYRSRLTGMPIVLEQNLYDKLYVRFDWRNSNQHPEGDVCMSESLADHLINVTDARYLASETFQIIQKFYKKLNIELWDMCLFITRDGKRIFSEISQDNARYKYIPTSESLDKDSWRSGNSSDDVKEKWTKLSNMVDEYTKLTKY